MIIDTQAGPIRVAVEAGQVVARSIPYAAAPIGVLRFAAPQPLARFATPCDATVARGAPPQPTDRRLGARTAALTTEGCLTLTIRAPCAPAPAGGWPVLVWIFGGGFVTGSADDPQFDGAALVAHGIVLVCLNYRLGLAGWLDLDGAATNRGLRDQLAGLAWIRANIAAFGGDPGALTLAGESAGAMSVANLLACSAALAGVRRAIAQSGVANQVDREHARATTHAVLRHLGAPGDPLGALQAMPIGGLVALQEAVARDLSQVRPGMHFRPYVDADLLHAGSRPRAVPLLAGSNREEYRLYIHRRDVRDDAALLARIARRFDCDAASAHAIRRAAVEHESAAGRSNHPAALWAAIETELRFRLPLLAWLRDHPAPRWSYLFTWPSPALNGWLAACHAIEIPFVFGTRASAGLERFAGTGPDADALAEACTRRWAAFVRDGDPGDPEWPAWTPAHAPTRVLDAPLRTVAEPAGLFARLPDGLLPASLRNRR